MKSFKMPFPKFALFLFKVRERFMDTTKKPGKGYFVKLKRPKFGLNIKSDYSRYRVEKDLVKESWSEFGDSFTEAVEQVKEEKGIA